MGIKMKVDQFIKQFGTNFFTGVPDSALHSICDFILENKGISSEHIIAANEGNCVAIATGAYLATGKIPVVYMQNSGIGNIINPVASLIHKEVYGIPCIFFIGWRGEPGTKDEPQHIYQGKVTLQLLKDMDIVTFVVSSNTTQKDVVNFLIESNDQLKDGKQIAFVFKKDAIESSSGKIYNNNYQLLREKAIAKVVGAAELDVVVASTGKVSRELYEVREKNKQLHCYDFLTVGSMGHTSSIALGIAIKKVNARVWCLEGDGAFLMHMGAMGVVGNLNPDNLIHVVFNNEAHDSVGGMPTATSSMDLCGIAIACGYKYAYSVKEESELDKLLPIIKANKKLTFIEIKVAIGSRATLGRPTIKASDNKVAFMKYLETLN